jgi:hypothetical protein
MYVITTIIFLECVGILQVASSTNEAALLTPEHRNILMCLRKIVHLHLIPRQALLISLPSVQNNVTVRELTHTHLHGDDFHLVDTFLQNASEDVQLSAQVSRPGVSQPETQQEGCCKLDSYIVFTGFQERESDVMDSLIEQLNVLESRGSWNFRAKFIIVSSVAETVSTEKLGLNIFEKMWKNYSVMRVLLITSVIKFKVNGTKVFSFTSPKNDSHVELQLYTWFPYASHTHCVNLHAVLIDIWTSQGEFVLKANLFPEKIPKTFHGCKSKVTTFVCPPAVTKTSDLKYTGIELQYLMIIFKKLNLTEEYNEVPRKYESHYDQSFYAISQLEPASLDVSIGILPLGGMNISAEATIPYMDFKISWYVPCPNPSSSWRPLFKFFSMHLSICYSFAIVVAIITMWVLARYARKNNVRESTNYMTIIYCALSVWAVATGTSLREKPQSISLRIFFVAWVWCALVMNTVLQTYFFGFLVNPGFEKGFGTLNDINESGIEYGFVSEMDIFDFSDPVYDIIQKHRKTCSSLFKCLERTIRKKDFATVSDNLRAEYFSTRLLFYNIHAPVCSLPDDIMRYSASTYMAKGNPLLYRFNKIIRHLYEAGLFEKWKKDFISDTRLVGLTLYDDDSNFEGIAENDFSSDYSPYSLLHLQFIFCMLLIGHTFSIAVLVGEMLYYRLYCRKETANS